LSLVKSLVKVEKKSISVEVRLSRPETKNAFDAHMISDLTKTFRSLAKDRSARFLVLTADGDTFCAGADLGWMKASARLSPVKNRADAEKLFEMFLVLKEFPRPTVTVVQGAAFGGGLGLVAASDIVLAEEGTKFSFSEVRLGLVPAVISSFILSKTSKPQVQEAMLTGRIFDARDAHDMGLLNFVGSKDAVAEKLMEYEKLFRNAGPEALQETKKLITALPTMTPARRRSQSVKVIADRRTSPEGQEGLRAFFEKRKPNWADN
jgi:methylglutaconyl-CoA hydratase